MKYFLNLSICILLSCRLFGQQTLSFHIFDQSTRSPLCYASVFNISQKTGSVTNCEGSCVVQYYGINDSLVISYIGFESLLTQVINLTATDTIFLKPHMLLLDEVTISSPPNQDVLVDQLYDVFSYNSRKSAFDYSKANMLVQSYIDNVPLERIESIGNLNLQNGGVFEYCHIMGRFGQNPESNFFTLSSESILSNFQLFELHQGNLPLLITQMNKNKIAKAYNLKREKLSNELTRIVFDAIEPSLFSGYVIFNASKDILRIQLIASDAPFKFIRPAFNDQSLDVHYIEYDMEFNEFTRQPRYINLKYQLSYDFGDKRKREIETNILLFISTHGKSFFTPVSSNGKFNKLTDYQQILANSFDSLFWERHYLLPPDKQDPISLKYFEENGYIANYQKYKSNSNLNRFLGLKLWDDHHPISFSDLSFIPENESEIRKNMNDVHNLYFNAELYKLDVGYFLIPDNKDSLTYQVKTYFNTANSYYFLNEDIYSQIALNLYFDSFEKDRMNLTQSIAGNTKDADHIFKAAVDKSRKEADNYLKNCRRGADLKCLVEWNDIIKLSLYTDRLLSVISDDENEKSGIDDHNPAKFNYCKNIGKTYFEMKQYERALLFFSKALSYNKNVADNILSRLYFDLGHTYLAIGETAEACECFNNAKVLGYGISNKFLNKNCSEYIMNHR